MNKLNRYLHYDKKSKSMEIVMNKDITIWSKSLGQLAYTVFRGLYIYNSLFLIVRFESCAYPVRFIVAADIRGGAGIFLSRVNVNV